jgi:hypothetical protein
VVVGYPSQHQRWHGNVCENGRNNWCLGIFSSGKAVVKNRILSLECKRFIFYSFINLTIN